MVGNLIMCIGVIQQSRASPGLHPSGKKCRTGYALFFRILSLRRINALKFKRLTDLFMDWIPGRNTIVINKLGFLKTNRMMKPVISRKSLMPNPIPFMILMVWFDPK